MFGGGPGAGGHYDNRPHDQAPLMGGGYDSGGGYPATNPQLGHGGPGGGYGHPGGNPGYDHQSPGPSGYGGGGGGGGYPPTQPQLGGNPGYGYQQPGQAPYSASPPPYGGAPPAGHKNDLFGLIQFTASCCIILGSMIGAIVLIFSFELVDCLEMICFGLFGFALAVVDNPYMRTNPNLKKMKWGVHKYVALITRVTGKGACYIFLACSLFTAMWTNIENGFLKFLAVIFNLYAFAVGSLCIGMGYFTSSKLNRVREQLLSEGLHRFQPPPGPQSPGYTPAEFNRITADAFGLKFTDNDLKYIFNALVTMPMWRMGEHAEMQEPKLPRADLEEWVRAGGFVVL